MNGRFFMTVKVDIDKCTGCGACVDVCPNDALAMDGDKVKVDDANCIDCGVCVDECPVEALEMV